MKIGDYQVGAITTVLIPDKTRAELPLTIEGTDILVKIYFDPDKKEPSSPSGKVYWNWVEDDKLLVLDLNGSAHLWAGITDFTQLGKIAGRTLGFMASFGKTGSLNTLHLQLLIGEG